VLKLVQRQLIHDPWRSLLTALAIAAVVAVILVLEGFNQGLLRQMRDAVLDRGADLIVTQAGVSNLLAARSILPQFARQEVEAVPGVAVAHPLTGIPVIYEQRGRSTPIFMLVYDTHGGPAHMASGHAPQQPRELVVDRSVAVKYNLRPGDPFVVSGFEFRISGVARGASAFFTAFAFARYDDLIDFYFESDMAADITAFPLLSFLLVELETGIDRETAATRIDAAVPEGDVFLPEVLAAEDQALGRTLFGPILRLMITVAYVIGLLVMAIIMFAAVNARRSQLGVLKALGFSNGFLAGAVVVEALCLVLIAVPLGVALAGIIAWGIETLVPMYVILPAEHIPVLRTLAASLGFTVLGSLVPVRLVSRLDPGMVFAS
jgi:putative ABC transport system permease protein